MYNFLYNTKKSSFLWDECPGVQLLGWITVVCYLRNCQIITHHGSILFLPFHHQCTRDPVFCIRASIYSHCFYIRHSDKCSVIPHGGFNVHSPNISWFWTFSGCCCIYLSSSEVHSDDNCLVTQQRPRFNPVRRRPVRRWQLLNILPQIHKWRT